MQKREFERYGVDIENPDDPRYETHKGFLDWAEAYETGGLDTRSKARHEKWLSEINNPFLRIEGTHSIEENTRVIMQKMRE